MKLTIHPTVTEDRVLEACERHLVTLDNPGLCLACGAEQDGCEPDARRYECESCGERQVYGADEVLMMGAYHPHQEVKP
jgi:Zn finger protein HypA/HybF involved in hydrogenase expression